MTEHEEYDRWLASLPRTPRAWFEMYAGAGYAQKNADRAAVARAGGRAITLMRGYPDSILLYAEHSRGGHTGDFYVEGCPTCDPEGAPLSESELRLLDGNR